MLPRSTTTVPAVLAAMEVARALLSSFVAALRRDFSISRDAYSLSFPVQLRLRQCNTSRDPYQVSGDTFNMVRISTNALGETYYLLGHSNPSLMPDV